MRRPPYRLFWPTFPQPDRFSRGRNGLEHDPQAKASVTRLIELAGKTLLATV
jgi:hypothetical protein